MLISSVIAFLFKSTLVSGIFLLYYWLFLRDRKLHQFNRLFLLASVGLSVIIPFVHFEWYHINLPADQPAFKLLQISGTSVGEHDVTNAGFSWLQYRNFILMGLYGFASLSLLGWLAAKIRWVYQLKLKSNFTAMHSFDLVVTHLDKAPFSFLNNLFWRNDIDIESPEGRQILKHELAHIHQKHTWDKLALQTITAICWLNPCYWIIQKELSLVHEFIADEEAIKDQDTEAFARMLLQTHYGNLLPDVVHPFFHSPVKRRLTMISQLSTRFKGLRKFMALPLLAGCVLLFSFKTGSNGNVNRSNKRIIMAVDAGHGGTDNGAVGANGVLEKDLNLRITKRITELAEENNIEIVPTHKEDETIPLQHRADIANDAEADVMLSIHVNMPDADNPDKKSGYEMVLDERNAEADQSRILASALSARLANMDIKTSLKQTHLMVLNKARMPAILIECGYIDNTEEMALLNNNQQLDRLCLNILNGVVDYQNHRK